MAGLIILDANVLIAFLDSTDAHHPRALDLLSGNLDADLAASVLTVAECLVHPAAHDDVDDAQEVFDLLGIRIIPLPAADALPLARVRAQYGLRMPDAVALFVARSSSAMPATFDHRLAQACGLEGVPTVR
ncbi:PIN domain-containing protein [Microbacteriaceae bacterium VKM Ac-2854]|nr:PIN domain-containing protein [Microbacteriaceae bacterium VKM Ac-2854]